MIPACCWSPGDCSLCGGPREGVLVGTKLALVGGESETHARCRRLVRCRSAGLGRLTLRFDVRL